MRILITGISGFLGGHLARKLAQAGHLVVGLDLSDLPEHTPAEEFVRGDVTDPEACSQAVSGCHAVFHLAARLGDWGPAESYLRVNVGGTRTLLEAAKAAGVRRFVLMSSVAIHHYGPGIPDGNEETPADGSMNAYALSKLLAERTVRARAAPMEWTIVRPAVFPFGPGDETGFGPLARALRRGLVPLVSGGRARLTTAYAGNLAEGLMLVLQPAGANQVFVLGDDEPVTWTDLLVRIARRIGAPRPRLSLPFRPLLQAARLTERLWSHLPLDTPPPITTYRVLLAGGDVCFFSRKAQQLLGFRPAVSLDQALDETAAWFLGRSSRFTPRRTP